MRYGAPNEATAELGCNVVVGGGGTENGRDPQATPLLDSLAETSTGVGENSGNGKSRSKTMPKFISNIFDKRNKNFNDISSEKLLSPGAAGVASSAPAGVASSSPLTGNDSQVLNFCFFNSKKKLKLKFFFLYFIIKPLFKEAPKKSLNNSNNNKLGVNAYNLLCNQSEFVEQAIGGCESTLPCKHNREIQAYVCLPYTEPEITSQQRTHHSSTSGSSHSSSLSSPAIRLIDRHMTHVDGQSSSSTRMSVYDTLRQYCAQKPRNCDFTTVNLNYNVTANNNPTTVTKPSSTTFNLAASKYFRRTLGRLVLGDLLNYIPTQSSSSPPMPHSYMTPNGLFVVSFGFLRSLYSTGTSFLFGLN